MLAAIVVADGQVAVFILCKKSIVVVADELFNYLTNPQDINSSVICI